MVYGTVKACHLGSRDPVVAKAKGLLKQFGLREMLTRCRGR